MIGRVETLKISSRFTVAVHTLLCIHMFNKEHKTTSEFIASSVNVNPVVIRRTLGQLKDAGLVKVLAGTGGAFIDKESEKITLFDIYKAVECVEDGLFNFHDNPNPKCPVGKNIHNVLDGYLVSAEKVFEEYLKDVTLADLIIKVNEVL